jgi:glutathione S-transferase
MIVLYQFSPVWGLPNPSPFCMKLENYLRMTGLPYKVAPHADVRKAPKGKFPYIVDGDRVVSDSGMIIDYLKATYGDGLDRTLTPAERAVVLAMQRLMDEHLYWSFMYDRWMVPDHWRYTRRAFFSFLAPGVRLVVAVMVRGQMRKQLHGQGMGRHSGAEIYALGKADLDALANFLGDKPYFMGAEPTSLDAVAYAFLAGALAVPFDSPLKAHTRSRPNLVAYCERMRQRYYADAAADAGG